MDRYRPPSFFECTANDGNVATDERPWRSVENLRRLRRLNKQVAAALAPECVRAWTAARTIQRAAKNFLYNPDDGVAMKRAKRSFESAFLQ